MHYLKHYLRVFIPSNFRALYKVGNNEMCGKL